MTTYRYKAATAGGEVVEGEMEAVSQDAVIRSLQAQGHVPIRADELGEVARPPRRAPSWLRRRRVSRRDVETLTVELSSMLGAGFPLEKALRVLINVAEHDPLRRLLGSIHAEVRNGAYLSTAMEGQGDVFTPFYVSMVRAGEAAGALDLALARLADFLERSRELRDSVSAALVYPMILLTVAVVSLMLILGLVVPQFSQMFEQAGASLPWPTQVVVSVGAFFEQFWWAIAAGLAGLYVYVKRQLQDSGFRLRWDARLLRVPVVRDLISKVETARFTRTLGTLLQNGVPLLKAMTIAKEIVDNRVLARGVSRVATSIREGQGLAGPLMEEAVLPKRATHMIQVGEETGRLEEMLLRVADIYDREVETAVRRLVALLEPTLILVLAVLIGGIIMSVVVAIFSINELGTL